jgi:sugar lactone lactonase YvrE
MRSFKKIAAVVAGAFATSALATDQLLISSFFSDQVTRHSLPDCAFLGTLQTGVGLDGTLCARLGPDGLLYVASEGTDSIQRYHPDSGEFIDNFVTAGSGGLDGPTGMTWNSLGQLIVPSFNNDRILKYDAQTGASLGTLVTSGSNGLNGPDNGTIIGPDGDLYVPSYFTNRVLRYDGETGVPAGVFIASIGRPRVLEFRGPSLFVTSETSDAVREYNSTSGAFIRNFTTPGAGGLDTPIGMAFDSENNMYVSSGTNDNVLRFDATTGAFQAEAIPPNAFGIDGPTFLTVIPEPGCAAAMVLLAAAVPSRVRFSRRR